MVINLSKTKEIVFKRPNLGLNLRPYPLDAIEQVLEVKLLGVVLDDRLNFDTHVHFV